MATRARILADYVSGGATAAEFDYLDGVTSSIQTQLDAKSPTTGHANIATVGTVATGTWGATDVAVAHGGTGASTHTANNVLIGAGTSAITSVAPGADGQVLTSTGTVWQSEAAAGGSSGITEADTWRITTSFTGAVNPITANWEHPDTDGLGYLGTGVTNSSGTFSFPSTGFWLIEAKAYMYYTSHASYGGFGIYTTVNDSAYGEAAIQHAAFPASGGYMGVFSSCIFDVTSTSTHKIQVGTTVSTAGIQFNGATGGSVTYVNFFKLGDT